MQVKAQGLLNAARHIEALYGRDALGLVLRAASPALRETYTSAIAINWHPLAELCEFVDLAEAQLGDGTGKLAEEIGAAGSRANLKGVVVRLAVYLTKPTFLMTRIAGLWRQFNDEGEMILVEMSATRAVLEVRGLAEPRATFCHVLTGWVGEVSRTLGAEISTVRHTQCRARGASRCLWEVTGRVPV